MDTLCKLNSAECYGVKELEVLLELSSLLSNKDIDLDKVIGTLDTILGKIEKRIIMDALIASKGNSAKAAKHLGITERMMGLRIKKYEIEPQRFKIKTQ